MIVQTKQQRKNTLEALNVMWPSVPARNVIGGLRTWRGPDARQELSCGSVACFGGWCAIYPKFVKQGIKVDSFGMPSIGTESGCYAARPLFGHEGIFQMRGFFSEVDEGFNGSDHELVTRRLEWLLKNSTVSA